MSGNNSECPEDDQVSQILSTPALVTATGVAMALMVTLGLLGNIAVVFGLVKFRRATNPYFFIITIMAAIDLLVCLMDVPLYGIFTLNKFRWPVPRLLCKPYLILDYLLCSMSSYCVAILSYDRSVLVMEPLRYQKLQTRRKVSCILLCCLLLANFHTPLILFWPEPGNTTTVCDLGCSVQYEDNLALQLCGVLIQFFLPFAATVISSFLVYARMRKRKQMFYTLQGGIAQFTGQDRMLTLAGKASRKAGKWLIVFDSIYTIMWLPCMLMVVIRTLVSRDLFQPSQPLFHVFQLCWWLLLCNSVVNPFLYIRSCDQVCSFYLGLLCRRCRQRRSQASANAMRDDGAGCGIPMRRVTQASGHNGATAPAPLRQQQQQQHLLSPPSLTHPESSSSSHNGVKRKLSVVAAAVVIGSGTPLLSRRRGDNDGDADNDYDEDEMLF